MAKNAIIFGAAILLLMPALPACKGMVELAILIPYMQELLPASLFCSGEPVEHAATIPQTSATILGLASFGFVLGIRFNEPYLNIQIRYMITAFISIILITGLQMAIIFYAYLNILYVPYFSYAMIVTTAALFAVGYCFLGIIMTGTQAGSEESKHADSMEKHAEEHPASGMANPDSPES